MHGMQGIAGYEAEPCESPASPPCFACDSWPKPTDSYRWVWPVAPLLLSPNGASETAPPLPPRRGGGTIAATMNRGGAGHFEPLATTRPKECVRGIPHVHGQGHPTATIAKNSMLGLIPRKSVWCPLIPSGHPGNLGLGRTASMRIIDVRSTGLLVSCELC